MIYDDTDYIALHPDENAIDFGCSYSYRAFYEETLYGRYLLPLEPLPRQRQVIPIIKQVIHLGINPETLELDKRLNEAEGAIKFLRNKAIEVEQRSIKRKPKSKYD